jgi:hypothetical protein
MRFIIALFLILTFLTTKAQLSLDSNELKSIIIAKCDSTTIWPLSLTMANSLPSKTIYLKGEIHSVDLDQKSFSSIFLGLHEQKGVNYILKEYNHSYFFTYNLFLKTGDVKILAELDHKLSLDSLALKKYYYYDLSLYRYNLKQPENKKISFIGVDIELQNAWQRISVQDNYKLAFKNFKKYALAGIPEEILILFDKILAETDYRILRDLSIRLREVSAMHVPELKKCFGEFYTDYYIIVNSVKVFPGVYREKEMLANFELAVKAIHNIKPTTTPRFFGSFGAAHVQSGGNHSFGSILNKSQNFKNQVSFIATGYYNGLSSYDKLKPIIWQGATIHGLSKNDQMDANQLVSTIGQSEKTTIVVLGNFNRLAKGKLDYLKPYDAMIIYTGF